MPHAPEVKRNALELLADREKSLTEVRNATGVPIGTLGRWAKEAGLARSDAKGTDRATDARRARIAKKRAKIAEEFLDASRLFVSQAVKAAEKPVEVKDGVMLMADGRTVSSLMTAAGIAIDKHRLEMGEHTSHEKKTTDTSVAQEVKKQIDELSVRRERGKKTA